MESSIILAALLFPASNLAYNLLSTGSFDSLALEWRGTSFAPSPSLKKTCKDFLHTAHNDAAKSSIENVKMAILPRRPAL